MCIRSFHKLFFEFFRLIMVYSSASLMHNACDSKTLISLAVTPSVTRGRAKMQKTVTRSLTRSTDTETHGHGEVITVALLCGESVSRKLTIRGGVSISHAPRLPRPIDTISCSNRCMLTLYCLIGHLIVISRRPTMRDTGTGI